MLIQLNVVVKRGMILEEFSEMLDRILDKFFIIIRDSLNRQLFFLLDLLDCSC